MSDFDEITNDDEPVIKSRTEIKKEMQALQDLGTKIVELSEKHIAMIPLQGKLEEAIYEARKMKHREGRRRQLQFIGKQMRIADNLDDIQQAVERIEKLGQEHNHIQHQAEQWRDKLMSDGDKALQALLESFPVSDIQHLRQLIRNAQKEASQQKPPASARKLFRYLRGLVEESY